jgi:6-pyruvoyltetrahydropterin/6-carboxytetrahydropterin synthase
LGFKTSSSFRSFAKAPPPGGAFVCSPVIPPPVAASGRGLRSRPLRWTPSRRAGQGMEPLSSSGCLFRMPIVTATRLLRFNAAHRVHNPALSDEENTRLFGKCNNPNWHGHNYTLEVSVKGPIDERTGYVIDLGMLRDTVERHVVDVTDHRNFNIDVPYMQGVNPTTENVIVGMWRVLEPVVAPGRLVRLRLWETENNYVDYEGE